MNPPGASAKTPSAGIRLRAMTAEDAPELARLEAEVEESPWSEGSFTDSLRSGHMGLVAEDPQAGVVGWAVVMRVLDEAELLIIGVRKSAQRRGIGGAMLDECVRRLRAGGCASLFLEVRAGNAPAAGLYRGRGFTEVGRRRNYYPVKAGGREDAILMRLELVSGESGEASE